MNLIMSQFLMECLRNSYDQNFDVSIINSWKKYAFDEGAVTLIKSAMLDGSHLVLMDGKESPRTGDRN